jgi:hypothetical protein
MNPRFSVFALLFVTVAMSFSSEVYAGSSNRSGNPFGNGTFFSTTGTFSAVVRGRNLSGTMLFSTGVNSSSAGGSNAATTGSSSGMTTISYLGDDNPQSGGIYQGNATGMWDPSSGSISGQLWGSYTLSGSGTNTIYPQIYNTNTFPVPINVVSNTLVTNTIVDPILNITNTYYTNLAVTNTIYVEPVGRTRYNDAVSISGNFSGNTQNSYPNQTFTAQGTLIQKQLYPQQQDTTEGTVPIQMASNVTIPITVQGIRISDSFTSYSTVSNSIPYESTTYTVTNFSSF